MNPADPVSEAPRPDMPSDVDAIDWSWWEPTERAVLCFVRDGDALLLIHEKTGLGAGKVNAPGGRVDPGETAEEAAVREVRGADPHPCGSIAPDDRTDAGRTSCRGTTAGPTEGNSCRIERSPAFAPSRRTKPAPASRGGRGS